MRKVFQKSKLLLMAVSVVLLTFMATAVYAALPLNLASTGGAAVKRGTTGATLMTDATFTEAAAGDIATGWYTLTFTLPRGLTFSTGQTLKLGIKAGGGAFAGNFPVTGVISSDKTSVSFTVDVTTVSTAAVTLKIDNSGAPVKVDVASNAPLGAVYVKATDSFASALLGGSPAQWAITGASVALPNIGLTANPDASVPEQVAQGKTNNAVTRTITLTDTAGSKVGLGTLTLTLPDGLTFSPGTTVTVTSAGTVRLNNQAAAGAVSASIDDARKVATVQVTAASAASDTIEWSGITVDVANDATISDVPVKLTVGGTAVSATLKSPADKINFLTIVAGATYSSTSPTVTKVNGQTLGTITLGEASAGFLEAGKTLTLTLTDAAGTAVNFTQAPTVEIVSGDTVFQSTVAAIAANVATWTCKTASTTASTIKISGIVVNAAGRATGPVLAAIAGSGNFVKPNITVAELVPGGATVETISPTISAGEVSAAGDINATETLKGSFGAGPNGIRVNIIAPTVSGNVAVQFTKAPKISMVTANGMIVTESADLTTTQQANFNVVNASTKGPAKFKITDIEYYVDPAAKGSVLVTIGTGTTVFATVSNAVIGTPIPLEVSPTSVSVAVNATKDVTVSGGTAPYTVASSDESVATATISDGTVTITGVAEGSCTITVSDSASPAQTATIAVTVTAGGAPAAGTSPTLEPQTKWDPTAHSVNVTATEKTDVTIAPSLNVPAADQGKSVNLYAAIVINNQAYLLKASSGLFGKTTFTWVHYTGGVLPSMGTATLGATQAFDLDLNNINLTGFTGSFDVYYGYATQADLSDFVGSSYEVTVQ